MPGDFLLCARHLSCWFTGYFCVPINILELVLGRQLLGNSFLFSVLLLRFVKWDESRVQSKVK